MKRKRVEFERCTFVQEYLCFSSNETVWIEEETKTHIVACRIQEFGSSDLDEKHLFWIASGETCVQELDLNEWIEEDGLSFEYSMELQEPSVQKVYMTKKIKGQTSEKRILCRFRFPKKKKRVGQFVTKP